MLVPHPSISPRLSNSVVVSVRCFTSVSSYTDRRRRSRNDEANNPLSQTDIVGNFAKLIEQEKFVKTAISTPLDHRTKEFLFKTVNRLLQGRSCSSPGTTNANNPGSSGPDAKLCRLPSGELCHLPLLLAKVGAQDYRIFEKLIDEVIKRLALGDIPLDCSSRTTRTEEPSFRATKQTKPGQDDRRLAQRRRSDFEIFIAGLQKTKLKFKGVQHVSRRFAEKVTKESVLRGMTTRTLVFVAEAMIDIPGPETVSPLCAKIHARFANSDSEIETALKDSEMFSRLVKVVCAESGKAAANSFIQATQHSSGVFPVEAKNPEGGRVCFRELKALLGKSYLKRGVDSARFEDVEPLLPLLRYFTDSVYSSEESDDSEKQTKGFVAKISSLALSNPKSVREVLWHCRGLPGLVRSEFVRALFLPEYKQNKDMRMDHSVALRWLEIMMGLDGDPQIGPQLAGIRERLVQRIEAKQGIIPNSMLVSLFLATEDLTYIEKLDCDRVSPADILSMGRVANAEVFEKFMLWAERSRWSPSQLTSLIILRHNSSTDTIDRKSADEKSADGADSVVVADELHVFERELYKKIVDAAQRKSPLGECPIQLAGILNRAGCYHSPVLHELRKTIVMQTLKEKVPTRKHSSK